MIENNQLKNTDFFTLLNLIYPSEQYNFKNLFGSQNKVQRVIFCRENSIYSKEKSFL